MPSKPILPKIYLAGPLFGVADRVHNLNLKRAFEELGYKVILPQQRANKFFKDGKLDLKAMVKDCLAICSDQVSTVIVANLDGADADSGTAMEYGYALGQGMRIVAYRTDIRTHLEQEIGVNAMLQVPGVRFIFLPSDFVHLPASKLFYRRLAQAIHEEIQHPKFICAFPFGTEEA